MFIENVYFERQILNLILSIFRTIQPYVYFEMLHKIISISFSYVDEYTMNSLLNGIECVHEDLKNSQHIMSYPEVQLYKRNTRYQCMSHAAPLTSVEFCGTHFASYHIPDGEIYVAVPREAPRSFQAEWGEVWRCRVMSSGPIKQITNVYKHSPFDFPPIIKKWTKMKAGG